MPAQPSPNSQLLYQPMNRWNMDAGSEYANGAAGSVTGMELYILKTRKATKAGNFWGPFMREGIDAPVRYVMRPGSSGGNKVTITMEGQLGGPGKLGGQRFAATGDFGTIPLRAQSIYLDLVKQATGIDPHAEEMIGRMLSQGVPEQIGAWGAQYIERQIDMTFLHKSAGTSRMVANGKTIATLTSADTMSWSVLTGASGYMKDLGGRPFITGRTANGRPQYNLMYPLVDAVATGLRNDPDYVDRVKAAGERGQGNDMFKGVISNVEGNSIVVRDRAQPQGQLSTGTCWAPYALLGVTNAYEAGGDYSTNLIEGGGNQNNGKADTPWFETFPGHQFAWNEASRLALADSIWGTGPYYALIVNPPTSADANKVGMIEYTVTSTAANTLTIVKRLTTASTSGSNVTTIGDGVTAAGLFAGKFTQEFYKGARIIPCNAKGQAIGVGLGVGGDSVGFIRGNRWGELFTDDVEGGLSGKLSYSGWTFGLEPFLNVAGDTPGIVLIVCAVSYPHLNLPEVT